MSVINNTNINKYNNKRNNPNTCNKYSNKNIINYILGKYYIRSSENTQSI